MAGNSRGVPPELRNLLTALGVHADDDNIVAVEVREDVPSVINVTVKICVTRERLFGGAVSGGAVSGGAVSGAAPLPKLEDHDEIRGFIDAIVEELGRVP